VTVTGGEWPKEGLRLTPSPAATEAETAAETVPVEPYFIIFEMVLGDAEGAYAYDCIFDMCTDDDDVDDDDDDDDDEDDDNDVDDDDDDYDDDDDDDDDDNDDDDDDDDDNNYILITIINYFTISYSECKVRRT
jgi:hypothetical protein